MNDREREQEMEQKQADERDKPYLWDTDVEICCVNCGASVDVPIADELFSALESVVRLHLQGADGILRTRKLEDIEALQLLEKLGRLKIVEEDRDGFTYARWIRQVDV